MVLVDYIVGDKSRHWEPSKEACVLVRKEMRLAKGVVVA